MVPSPERLAGVLRGAWPVLVTLVGLHFALWLLFGMAPRRLAQAELVEPKGQLEIVVRLAQVEALLRRGETGAADLAVMIGFSTAREGVDPAVFSEAAGGRLKLLNLAGSGGSFFELRSYFGPLDWRPRPQLFIIAVHPCWLAGRELRTSGPDWAQVIRQLRREPERTMQVLNGALSGSYWPTANRLGVHYEVRRQLQLWRVAVASSFSVPPAQWASTPPSDPWRPRLYYQGARAPAWSLERQMRYWQDSGWFDAGRYSQRSDEARALQDLLVRARAAADRAVVVLMPESEALRRRVPEVATNHLRALAQPAVGDSGIVDLRDAMPEDHFYDHAHLNETGRRAFSALLAARLARVPGT